MNIILLGAPGAGKGTQARIVMENRGMVHLSTGEMLRGAAKAGTPVGLKAKAAMDAGNLVSDAIVIGIVDERLDGPDVAGGVIFDGFPRTDAQAHALDELLAEKGMTLDAVVNIEVDDEAMVERISGRFTCANCGEGYHDTEKVPAEAGRCDKCGATDFKRRADDNAETVRSRLIAYHAETEPLIAYYQGTGKLKNIDGMAEIADVAAAINRALDGL